MAQQGNSNNDLDIKLGITIEDYATVASKIDELIKKLQTDKKFTIKVDLKGINKQAEDAKKSLTKVKTEFDDLGRGYNKIAKAMKKLYQDSDTTVSTSYEGSKRNVSEFTVSLIKANDQIEKLRYTWNDAKKGFVFDGKRMVDMSGINESIKQSKLKIERIAYDTKFKAINRKNSQDILNLPAIKAQIEDIKTKIKELDKLPLSQFKVEAQVITKEFANLQENIMGAKAAAKAANSTNKGGSKSGTNSNKGNVGANGVTIEAAEVTKLSNKYEELYRQITKLYGNKGQISVVSKNDLNDITSFIVKLKEADGFVRELKYIWDADGGQGFYLDDIKNTDNREETREKALQAEQKIRRAIQLEEEKQEKANANAREKALQEEQKIRRAIAAQAEAENKAEVERLNQISNLRKDYEIKIQNISREHSGAMNEAPIADELKRFQQELKNLNTVPVDKLGQKTKELNLAWKQFRANIQQTSSVMRSSKYDTWIDAITKKTKEFFTWYISANAVMQSKNFLMDSVRQINEMDTATVELSKVTDLSSHSLNNMSDAAIELSKALGKVNASEIMLSMAEFGRVTKDVKEIEQLAKIATMASNVTSFTADEAAKAINTTVLSMNMDLSDSMMILDQFNEIQNNYRTSAEDLAESIGAVGAIAEQSGISLAKLNGYTTAIVSSTGQSGAEAGTAWVK